MATGQIGVALEHIHYLFHEGTVAGLPDAALLERFVEHRDERAFAVLVERHGPMILGTCRAVLKDAHLAEDAFQAAFLILARKARAIRGRDAIGGWLHRVAYRIAIQANADTNRRRLREYTAGVQATQNRSARPVDDDLRSILHAELERLPEKLRLAVVLCDLEGLTRQQAAHQLKWTEWVVRRRLERGRELLRHRLSRRGFAVTTATVAGSFSKESLAAIPEAWVTNSVRAAVGLGSRATSAATIALSESVLRGMALVRWKLALLTALAGFALAGTGVAGRRDDDARNAPRNRPVNAAPMTPLIALRNTSDQDHPQANANEDLRILGRVLAPNGKPIRGAAVRYGSQAPDQPGSIEPRAVTSADGRFQFTVPHAEAGEPGRDRLVVASAEGYGFDWTTLDESAHNTEIILRLVPDDAPIEGRVLDLQARPVVGAVLHLRRVEFPRKKNLDDYLRIWKLGDGDLEATLAAVPSNAKLAGLASSVRTDKDGRFSLRGIGRERIARFEVTGPGIEQTEIRVLTRRGLDAKIINAIEPETQMRNGRPTRGGPQPQGASFELLVGPGRTVSGTVRGRDGNPLAGSLIRGSAVGDGHHQNVEATTDTQGHYQLDGLGVGVEVQVDAHSPERMLFLPASRSVSPAGGVAPAILDFELERGVKVRGRVVDHATGKPVSGGNVLIIYRPQRGNTLYENTPTGAWMRHVLSADPVQKDGTFEVVAGPGPGAILVQLQGELRNRYLDWRRSPKAKKGEAEMTPGASSPFAFAMAIYHSYVEISPRLDSPQAPCEIRLEPAIERSGTVVAPDGQALPDVTVAGLSNRFDEPRELATASFTVEALDPQGARYILASHVGRKLAGYLAVSGRAQDSVTLKLEPWATVTGRIVEADGQAVKGMELVAYYTGDKSIDMFGSDRLLKQRISSDENGRFQLPGVVPDLKTTLGFRKQGSAFAGGEKVEGLMLQPGETRDLGEIVVKPYP